MVTKTWSLAIALAGGLSIFVVAEAGAVPIASETFQFTSDHCTGGCLTGQTSGGTVTVTDLGSGTLEFSISLLNGNQFINGGFDASFGFNLASNPTITYSNINPAANYTIPGVIPVNKQAAGSLHMDGTGFFEYGLDGVGNGGSDPLGSSLVFDINAAGLTLTSLQQNSDGQFFAADIISGTTGTPNRNTGGIDVSNPPTPVNVPEPRSLFLVAVGLIAAGFVRWRRNA